MVDVNTLPGTLVLISQDATCFFVNTPDHIIIEEPRLALFVGWEWMPQKRHSRTYALILIDRIYCVHYQRCTPV